MKKIKRNNKKSKEVPRGPCGLRAGKRNCMNRIENGLCTLDPSNCWKDLSKKMKGKI